MKIKNITKFISIIILIAGTLFGCTLNDKSINENFTYVVENNEIVITNYIGKEKDVIIPNKINGMPVTKLRRAFLFNDNIVSVTLPNTITELSDETFMACKNLKTVNLNNNLKIIGKCAFANCSSLTKIDLPKTVEEIGVNAFVNCPDLDVKSNNSYCKNYISESES